jgi:large subunit ribosomal protein L19e
MTLEGQRRISSEILGVGKNKVWFDKNRLDDIKKAITRLDVKELIKEGAIKARIKRKVEKKAGKIKKRRGTGKRKIRVMRRKEKYIKKIRKLRKYIHEIFEKKIINQKEKKKLRVMARSGELRNLRHLQEYLATTMNKKIEVKEYKK